MYISIPLESFKKEYLYFSEGVKNNIMEDSKFYRISYSNEYISLKTLIFELNLSFHEPTKHNIFNNHSMYLEKTQSNEKVISQIIEIERQILQLFFTGSKRPKFSIRNLLSGEKIKIDNPQNIHIKISGIWETEKEYGITYRLHNFDNLKNRRSSFTHQAY